MHGCTVYTGRSGIDVLLAKEQKKTRWMKPAESLLITDRQGISKREH